MTYEPVIGLEIHVELLTATKLFCGCLTGFGAQPNSQCCPVCLGLPGALPVLNRRAVEFAVMAGLALGCRIHTRSKFDRKNYFYPDLPKAYQISQFDLPFCVDGAVSFELDGGPSEAGITRVHLEEEAGKSVHSGDSILGSTYSSIDYNRSGIPLIEIVTEPDLRSPEAAKAFLEQLRTTLQYTGVSDCKMQEGSLRCDANVSLRPVGQEPFGTKVEVKNMNSFRAVERALAHEIHRQTGVLTGGDTVSQETRAWDEARGVTVSMRSKEESHDYRYFPEPDLMPVTMEAPWIEGLRARLPELPLARKRRFCRDFSLSHDEAYQLTQSRETADFFEAAAALHPSPKAVSNWINGELARLLNEAGVAITASPVTPEMLSKLLDYVKAGTISSTAAKDVLEDMFVTKRSAELVIKEKGLEQISDSDAIGSVVQAIIEAHPEEAAAFRAGKDKVLGFFVGQVMREMRGKANPQVVNELLRQKLRN